MRLPLGSTDLSASGGTVTLVGRRGDAWQSLDGAGMALERAIEAVEALSSSDVHAEPGFATSVPSGSAQAGFFSAGEQILWRYGRFTETARVVRDDARGLVVWIPSGSERLESVPADGRRTRDIPLHERFGVPTVTRQSTWTGPGVLRVAPSGKPWSVWFFRDAHAVPQGAYVNLEVPHRRGGAVHPGIFSRDLVLDLWIDAGHPGSEDIWLKDADELEAVVRQGRFTPAQADAVRAIADHAAREFVVDGRWPLDEGWERWSPDAAMDEPLALPAIR